MLKANKSKYIVLIFFLLYFFQGLLIHKDYGVTWDEYIQRNSGLVSAVYIKKVLNLMSLDKTNSDAAKTKSYPLPDLKEWEARDYGVLFELILVGAEFLVFKPVDSKELFETRHFTIFLIFWVGMVFFYLLILKLFKDWKYAIAGCLFLLLSPRIFAHSFYNSKDIPFLVSVILATFTLINLLRRPTLINAVAHAVTSSIVINARMVGIYVFLISILFIVMSIIKDKKRWEYLKTWTKPIIVYILGLVFFTYLFWPFLWENPVGNFLYAFKRMSDFKGWDLEVLYLGETFKGNKLPWHYIPVWIFVSTPVVYSILFSIGFLFIICKFLIHPIKLYEKQEERDQLIIFCLFISPLLAVIVRHSTLYGGWRHLFFIYPFFILISLFGIRFLIRCMKQVFRGKFYELTVVTLVIICICSMFQTAFFMVRNHPHQNVYFNKFAGNDVSKKFELDYWGASYKQALEYILKNDQGETIYVNALNWPGEFNRVILDEKDRNRIKYVPLNEATYFISNYQWNFASNEYDIFNYGNYPYQNEIFSIKVNNIKIMGVYKL